MCNASSACEIPKTEWNATAVDAYPDSSDGTHGPANAIDGNITGFWNVFASQAGRNGWLEIDFGSGHMAVVRVEVQKRLSDSTAQRFKVGEGKKCLDDSIRPVSNRKLVISKRV